ncbi:MAG: putative toxin-antitoxin system toxin component, PIN family [Patescibacteria group bacterium]
MIKVVLDTNVLITAERGAGSFGRRILDLVLQQKIKAVISDQVKRENLLIVNRLVKDESLKRDLGLFLDNCQEIRPAVVNIHLEDEQDLKLLAAAVGGRADYLITEDKHLLDLENFQQIKIIKPSEFWQLWQKQQDDQGETWNNWAQNIFGK